MSQEAASAPLSLSSKPVHISSIRKQRQNSIKSQVSSTSAASPHSPPLSPVYPLSSVTSGSSDNVLSHRVSFQKPYNPFDGARADPIVPKSRQMSRLSNGDSFNIDSKNDTSMPEPWWIDNAASHISSKGDQIRTNKSDIASVQSHVDSTYSSRPIGTGDGSAKPLTALPMQDYPIKDSSIQYASDFNVNMEGYAKNTPDDPYEDYDEDEEQSPVEIVRITVSNNDEVGLPVFTVRFWLLLTLFTIFFCAVNEYYFYREEVFALNALPVQLLSYPLGKLMEKLLPAWSARFPIIGKYSLNPGPFNMKEHALIVIGVNSAIYQTSSIIPGTLNFMYSIDMGSAGTIFTVIGSQLIGPSLAGFCIYLVVQPAFMIWPDALSQVSFYYALHEPVKKFCFGLSRIQFVWMVLSVIMMYQVLPTFIIPFLSSLPLLCWFAQNNYVVNNLGSSYHGVGLLSFSLDWSQLSNFTPLISPWWAQVNFQAGYILFAWLLLPCLYFTNWHDSLKYYIFSERIVDDMGHSYNFSQIINEINVTLIPGSIEEYSPIVLPPALLFNYIFSAMGVASLVSYVGLWYGPEIANRTLDIWRPNADGSLREHEDVHTKLMKRYPSIPWTWYAMVFAFGIVTIAVTMDVQAIMPWWATVVCVLVSLALGLFVNIIAAKTIIYIDTSFLMGLIGSYILPGSSLGNLAFRNVAGAVVKGFYRSAYSFKLAQYIKISPRKVFITIVYSTIIGALANYVIYSQLLVHNRDDLLATVNLQLGQLNSTVDNGWTLSAPLGYFTTSNLFGTVGLARVFNWYPFLPWSFLVGFLLPLPLFIASRYFPTYLPRSRAILLCWPVIFRGTQSNQGNTVILTLAICFFSMRWLIRNRQRWWRKYVYVTSVSLDVGTAATYVIVFLIADVILPHATFPTWFGNEPQPFTEHCKILTPPGQNAG